MNDKYILVGHEVIAEPNVIAWAKWFESADRIVKAEKFEGRGITVSTIFLGRDQSFVEDAPPVLFETMVFGGEFDGVCRRYCTWDEAIAGHDGWVARLKAGEPLE